MKTKNFWQIQENSKLIAITRRDLIPGSQAVQAAHATIQFIFEHPEMGNDWYNISKYLVFLSVENKQELLDLVETLDQKGIVMSKFHEPDLDNDLTAIAIEPSPTARRLVSSLPLMLKNAIEIEKVKQTEEVRA